MECRPSSQFRLPPGIIDIARFERESRKYLYLGLVVGLLVHLAILPFVSYPSFEGARASDTAARRITTDLIVLPPSIANPYETWRREPVRRTYIRQESQIGIPIISSSAGPHVAQLYMPTDRTEFIHGVAIDEMLRTFSGWEDSLIREAYPVPLRIPFPSGLAISREPEDRVTMSEELIDFDDIDALGEFKAFVVRDLSDKQNIRGYFHIPQLIFSESAQSFSDGTALAGLGEAFNYYTGLELKLDDPIGLSSKELLAYPVVYMPVTSMRAFALDESQVRNLRTYIERGGFIIFENGRPWNDWTPGKASILTMLTQLFGETVELRQIPSDHPINYCFFEFDSLPPEGAENWIEPLERVGMHPDWGDILHNPALEPLREQTVASPGRLWGVWRDDRLAAVFSDKGYGHIWQDGIITNQSRDFYANSGEKYNFNPQLKLGVNVLVYALLQEGGIAMRVTDNSLR